MKLKTIKNSVETSDDFQEMSFGIRSCDMGIILEILRSKMYKNPIGAICREVASNSRDANREANNKDAITIQIDHGSLFSTSDLTISFIDNGPGISPDRMSDVFINYGASTKRTTNTQTGGFGLGAKTPFAYTDNFIISTRVDGLQYIYTAVIEENNTGKIYLMSKESTKEKNGTKITIPIKIADLSNFETEVMKCTYFWKVRPKYINFERVNEKIELEKIEDCFCCESDLFHNNFYLVIDDIPYQHDGSVIKIGLSYAHSSSVFLPFKTGILTISANRESVQYDKSTIKAIESKWKSLLDSIFAKVTTELANCKTFVEAALLFKKNSSSLFYNLMTASGRQTAFTYDGKNIDYHLTHRDLRVRKVTENGLEHYPTREYTDDMLKFPIYAVDSRSLVASRNKTIFKINEAFFIIEFTSKDLKSFKKLSFKNRKHFAKRMHEALNWIEDLRSKGFTIKLYSTVIPTKTAKVTTPKELNSIAARVLTSKMKFRSYPIHLSRIKSTDKIAYQTFNGKGLYNPIVEKQKLKANFIYRLERIETYFINQCNEKHVVGKISSLDDVIKTLSQKKLQSIADSRFAKTQNLDITLQNILKLDFSSIIKDQIKLLQSLQNQSLFVVPKEFELKASQKVGDAISAIKEIIYQYPLIKFYDTYYTKGSETKQFNQYIKLIDGQKGSQHVKSKVSMGSN